MTDNCACHRLAVGLTLVADRDWNPDCPEHGTASTWWNSPGQTAERARRREESIALQRKAAELRRRARDA